MEERIVSSCLCIQKRKFWISSENVPYLAESREETWFDSVDMPLSNSDDDFETVNGGNLLISF